MPVEPEVCSMVLCLNYAPSGDILAVGDLDGNIHLFDCQDEKFQSPVRGHRYALFPNLFDFSNLIDFFLGMCLNF